MVLSGEDFIGAPNNGFLKGPASDDEIEVYINEVDPEDADDPNIIYMTDEDTSYVDDTFDEDDYYFSEVEGDDDDDDEDFLFEEQLDISESDNEDPIVLRISDNESENDFVLRISDNEAENDKSAATAPTQKLGPNANPPNNG